MTSYRIQFKRSFFVPELADVMASFTVDASDQPAAIRMALERLVEAGIRDPWDLIEIREVRR